MLRLLIVQAVEGLSLRQTVVRVDDSPALRQFVRLGAKPMAEGVETEEQLTFLEDRGCDEYQGYLFGKPVAPAEWAALIRGDGSDS